MFEEYQAPYSECQPTTDKRLRKSPLTTIFLQLARIMGLTHTQETSTRNFHH